MHTQKHIHKKHPTHLSYTARRRKQAQPKTKKICRLCVKTALCASVFTLTLLVSSEWNIQKPQTGYWKQYSSDHNKLQAGNYTDPDKISQPTDATGQGTASDPAAAGSGSKKKDSASSNSKNKLAAAEDSKKKNQTGKSKESEEQTATKKAGTDSLASAKDSSLTAQPDGSGNLPSYTEYDQSKPQQAPGTDERTLYTANPDTEIYYSYEDNQVQFSANAGQSIQAVPERLPEEQRIDTTTDDTDTAHYQQLSSKWNLILVNPWNEIPDDYEITLAGLPNGHSIDSRCYPALTEMMDACRSAGLRPLICSSYRSREKQQSLFLERIDELTAQGYTKKEARQKAATSVARPGTSEHQAGLAVDIVDSSHQLLDSTQEHTPVQQWLMENSWKYGFILRYPLDKSRLTGIIYEPWHYRYVGKEAAKEIYERGICLEEYLEERS